MVDYSKWDKMATDSDSSDDSDDGPILPLPPAKATTGGGTVGEKNLRSFGTDMTGPFRDAAGLAGPGVVTVEIVDMSKGLMGLAGEALLGDPTLDGIYHCSVHVHGLEIWFHLDGLHRAPSTTAGGAEPFHTFESHGRTAKTREAVDAWCDARAQSYDASSYDLWTKNCNHFAGDLLAFLGVDPLPGRVTEVPTKVLASPLGATLRPTIDKAIAVLKASSRSSDASIVDEFLEKVVEQPGGMLLGPIVKMMRSIKDDGAKAADPGAKADPVGAEADPVGETAAYVEVDDLN